MNNIYDVLEICLQELEHGADLNAVLARYPDLANELRPILKASVMAKSMVVPAPSPDAVRRGRAKLLQRASEMREQKVAPRKRMIPVFQRLAISFTLTALFLASGTGLVGASSNALPGENLYPVKRTWEGVRLFFAFNPDHKELLQSEFESERLNEVGELLAEGRGDETIQYSGIFMQVNGVMYVSGVKVLLPANLQLPADGAAVVITGRTNAQRFVEIESIELLPAGAVVPVGEPVEVDNESNSGSGSEDGVNSNSGSSSEDGIDSGSGNEAQGSGATETPKSDPQSFEMKGTVESISGDTLIINGQTVYLNTATIDGVLVPGANVEVKGYYAADGRFIVTEVKVKDSASGKDGGNENSNSGSKSDSSSNDNSGSDSKDGGSNSNDDNSGSGGGGGDD
jgi:hypothetical protein